MAKRIHICRDLRLPAGIGVEITITAALDAKRDMNVNAVRFHPPSISHAVWLA
jgi:hypothetical protein